MMKRSNYFITKLLYNKKFTIPFSLLFAIILWLVITISENPVRERVITGLPVSIVVDQTQLTELGLDVVKGGTGQTVDVVVKGPSYIVSALTSDDIIVKPDLNKVTASGNYDLDLIASPNSNSTGYEIVNVNPSTINVTFDYIDTRTFDVTASAEGVVAKDGLVAEPAIISKSENKTITIKGVRSDIAKIDSVVALVVTKEKLSKTKTYDDAVIVLYDAKGNELDIKNYTLSFDTTQITVPISRKKTVNIVPSFTNVPQYYKEHPISYTLDVTKATVIGPADTIDKLDEITLSAIDFTAISSATAIFDANITLPDGVKIVDNIETVNVKISLPGYTEKVFKVTDFKFENKPSGTSAKGRALQNVKVCGPASEIRKLKDEDIYAYVDLSGKDKGEHLVKVVIKSDKCQKLWQVGEYTATVTVE